MHLASDARVIVVSMECVEVCVRVRVCVYVSQGAQVISDGVISLLSQEGTLSSARLCELLPPALASAQTTQ